MNKIFEKTQIWKIAIVFLVANVLNYAISIGLRQIFHFDGNVGEALARGLIFVVVIIWFILLFRKNKVSIRPELNRLHKDIRIKEFAAVLVFNYAVSIAMVLGLLLAVVKLLPAEMFGSLMNNAAEPQGFAAALIGLVTASILAPISEELMFRGVLLTRMQSRFGVTAAILVSSMLFGMTHLSLAMLRAAIFGACMCILYLKTKNILVPIILHMVYNFIITMADSYEVLFGFKTTAEKPLELNVALTIFEIVVCLFAVIISGSYLSRKFNFWDLKQYKVRKETTQ